MTGRCSSVPPAVGIVAAAAYVPQVGAQCSWSLLPVSGPSARCRHAIAYDLSRQRLVLFGGYDSDLNDLGDTWEWDGNSWTQVLVSGPSPRRRATMAYDPFRGACVLVGGIAGLSYLADAWECDGTWRPLPGGPSARADTAMIYRTADSTLYLFGGESPDLRADTWAMTCSAAPCYPNCDGSTATPLLNVNDFICFQQQFAAGESYANCDQSTSPPVLNVNDLVCFQSAFVTGCR